MDYFKSNTKSCCCCISLRKGTLTLGYLTIILSLLELVILETTGIFYMVRTLSDDVSDYRNNQLIWESALIIFPVFLYAYQIITAAKLIQGVNKKLSSKLLPWITLQEYHLWLMIGVQCLLCAVTLIYEQYNLLATYIVILVFFVLWYHFIEVVRSYNVELGKECNKSLLSDAEHVAVSTVSNRFADEISNNYFHYEPPSALVYNNYLADMNFQTFAAGSEGKSEKLLIIEAPSNEKKDDEITAVVRLTDGKCELLEAPIEPEPDYDGYCKETSHC